MYSSQINVDPIEVEKFSKLAKQWWDPNGPLKTLHDINPLRLHFILEGCLLEDKAVLDVGCGGGILTESLAHHAKSITGIDASQEAITIAKSRDKAKIHYERVTAEDFSQNHPEAFDVVICMELIEHVPDPTSLIAALAALTKPGGTLIVSTLNRTPSSYLKAIIGAEYILGLLDKGTHRYDRFIKPSELRRMCMLNQLKLKRMQGMHYNPISQAFKLNDDVQVNYLAHFCK